MALSSASGVPHKGWTLLDVIDSRDDGGVNYDDYQSCEYCDQEKIRYVHVLSHPDFHRSIKVGCICSCHLTTDYVTPKRLERLLRNLAARRTRFVKKARWDLNRYGGETIELDGHRVTVSRKPAGYRIWIDGREGKTFYESGMSAKTRAFNAVQEINRKRG